MTFSKQTIFLALLLATFQAQNMSANFFSLIKNIFSFSQADSLYEKPDNVILSDLLEENFLKEETEKRNAAATAATYEKIETKINNEIDLKEKQLKKQYSEVKADYEGFYKDKYFFPRSVWFFVRNDTNKKYHLDKWNISQNHLNDLKKLDNNSDI